MKLPTMYLVYTVGASEGGEIVTRPRFLVQAFDAESAEGAELFRAQCEPGEHLKAVPTHLVPREDLSRALLDLGAQLGLGIAAWLASQSHPVMPAFDPRLHGGRPHRV